MRPIVLALTLAPLLVGWVVSARAVAPESANTPVTIPNLATWTRSGGKPTAIAWRHAAHFSVDNEIQPGHNLPAPLSMAGHVQWRPFLNPTRSTATWAFSQANAHSSPAS